MTVHAGDRLVADYETLRSILEVQPENCIHVVLFNMEPQTPVQLASEQATLDEDFATAKEKAASLIAATLGLRGHELDQMRASLTWRLPQDPCFEKKP